MRENVSVIRKNKHMQLIISAGVITVFTVDTHAAKPSYFIIFNAQSHVFLYLCASRPFGEKTHTFSK